MNVRPLCVALASLTTLACETTAPTDAFIARDAQATDAPTPPVDAPIARADAPRPPACTPGAYEGSAAWPGLFTVEAGASLCAYSPREIIYTNPDDYETPIREALRDALSHKSTIQISPGAYALPTTTTASRLALPMCLSDEGMASVAVTAASTIMVQTIEGDGFNLADGHYVNASLPAGSAMLDARIRLELASDRATLTAAPATTHLDVSVSRTDRLYASCAIAPNACWSLAFPGLGTVQLDEYTWRASPGLGFAVATQLSGRIQETPIDISAYEDITTVYGHHAFDRHTFFRFAAPIGGACGLRVDNSVEDAWQASLADCNGLPMGTPITGTATSESCG